MIYVLVSKDGQYAKIGWTRDRLYARIREINAKCVIPKDYMLVCAFDAYSIALERMIHEKFATCLISEPESVRETYLNDGMVGAFVKALENNTAPLKRLIILAHMVGNVYTAAIIRDWLNDNGIKHKYKRNSIAACAYQVSYT